MKIANGLGQSAKYLGLYVELFCHRKDAYALQTDEGTYYAVRKPVTPKLIEAHLLGRVTAGWYALDGENTLRWAALDADEEDGLSLLQRVGLVLREKGWPTYLEDSRRGGHLWIFFPLGERREERMGARPVRAALGHLLAELGLEERVELFPKQDELREGGLGSLMRGPLGVHRACGKRFSFLDLSTLEPVGKTLTEELRYMTGFQAVTGAQVAEELARILEERSRSLEPPQLPKRAASSLGGGIQELKEEIGDLYQFISQFVKLDEKGRGHCPFHPPDRHPSFAVNREENYWVDFHDHTGGDAIAFFQRLKGLGFLEAVKELARIYGRADLVQRLEGTRRVTRDETQVLTEEQLKLLESAERGELLCPRCGEVLRGEFSDFVDIFVGVLLSCRRCSFLELFNAPAESWGRRRCDGGNVTLEKGG